MITSNITGSSQAHSSIFASSTSSPSTSTDPFAQELAAELENYLGSVNTPANSQVDIQPVASQTSGSRQYLVTVTPPETTEAAPETDPPAVQPEATKAAPPAPKTEEDAYWATQPPAVQALRNIPDEGDREVAAKQLADQGYRIDVPIMVWQWDPLITMSIRQANGYTWVPSGDQANIPTAPHCDLPGQVAYDPNSAPAGSIKVSTDFAKGLESTAPWGFSISS